MFEKAEPMPWLSLDIGTERVYLLQPAARFTLCTIQYTRWCYGEGRQTHIVQSWCYRNQADQDNSLPKMIPSEKSPTPVLHLKQPILLCQSPVLRDSQSWPISSLSWKLAGFLCCAAHLGKKAEDGTGQGPEQPALTLKAALLWAADHVRDPLKSLSTQTIPSLKAPWRDWKLKCSGKRNSVESQSWLHWEGKKISVLWPSKGISIPGYVPRRSRCLDAIRRWYAEPPQQCTGLIAERQLPPAKVEKSASICWVYLILPKLVPINTKGLLSETKIKWKIKRSPHSEELTVLSA